MFYLTAISLGLALAAMCLGIYISLRIFNFPDITTDGSYTLGACITAVGIVSGWSLPMILLLVIVSGMLAGLSTGLIHTGLKMNSLLSGILVMTGLYSINLAILGRSNIPLPSNSRHIFKTLEMFQKSIYNELAILIIIIAGLVVAMNYFLKTDFGLALRATGNNTTMSRMYGIHANAYKVTGLAIANALTAFSGFLIVQLQGFADINMGIGIVILGLGAVMIGESMMNIFNAYRVPWRLVGVILGSILFRVILSVALSAGVDPLWIKLLTAIIVLVIVGIPNMFPHIKRRLEPD